MMTHPYAYGFNHLAYQPLNKAPYNQPTYPPFSNFPVGYPHPQPLQNRQPTVVPLTIYSASPRPHNAFRPMHNALTPYTVSEPYLTQPTPPKPLISQVQPYQTTPLLQPMLTQQQGQSQRFPQFSPPGQPIQLAQLQMPVMQTSEQSFQPIYPGSSIPITSQPAVNLQPPTTPSLQQMLNNSTEHSPQPPEPQTVNTNTTIDTVNKKPKKTGPVSFARTLFFEAPLQLLKATAVGSSLGFLAAGGLSPLVFSSTSARLGTAVMGGIVGGIINTTMRGVKILHQSIRSVFQPSPVTHESSQ